MKREVIKLVIVALIFNSLFITSCSTDDSLEYQIDTYQINLENDYLENGTKIIDSIYSNSEHQNENSIIDLDYEDLKSQSDFNKDDTGGEDDDTVDPEKGESD
ncbi:hypothetical protein [Pontimicrobium sp. MEBiC06410]